MKRRSVLAGLLSIAAPAPAWSDIGRVAYVSAGRLASGGHILAGLSENGQVLFRTPLPARGHAAAVHPSKARVAVFARRPGRFLMLMDALSGAILQSHAAPDGRHFYGHGVFSQDGGRLYTTENDYDAGVGRIGVWDCAAGLRRIGDLSSGGTGPHDIKLTPDGARLIVANGGIRTHPDTGREKLNLATMKPNVAILDVQTGAMDRLIEPEPALRLNSTRHLAIDEQGRIAIACQWQGDAQDGMPVLAIIASGADTMRFVEAGLATQIAAQGYAGSVAFGLGATMVAITCPRGNRVLAFGADTLKSSGEWQRTDVCGIASGEHGFVATDGLGGVSTLSLRSGSPAMRQQCTSKISWDNHLVATG